MLHFQLLSFEWSHSESLSVGLLGFLPLVSLLDYSLVYWYVISLSDAISVFNSTT